MTRKKVKLAYITNDSARKATFKKRKKGLMKKVSELSTLCGINACAIIYSPYDMEPELWPPNPVAVQRVVAAYREIPEMEQGKKKMNQESFLRQRLGKANEQLKKQRKENREKEVRQIMFQCLTGKGSLNLDMLDLNDLGWFIEQTLKEINKRIASLKTNVGSSSKGDTKMVAMQPAKQVVNVEGERPPHDHQINLNIDVLQKQQHQQWFMDLMQPQDQHGNVFGGEVAMINNFGQSNIQNPNTIWPNIAFFP